MTLFKKLPAYEEHLKVASSLCEVSLEVVMGFVQSKQFDLALRVVEPFSQ